MYRDDDVGATPQAEAAQGCSPGRKALVIRVGAACVAAACLTGGILLVSQGPGSGRFTGVLFRGEGSAQKQVEPPQVVAEGPPAAVVGNAPGKRLPVWSEDGEALLYVDEEGRLVRIRLSEPIRTEILGEPPVTGAIPGPDADSVVYVAPRATGDGNTRPMTLFLRSGTAEPVDLLPGEAAVHGISTGKFIHRWVEPSLLAFEEHVGTGTSQLLLLDVEQKALLATPRLAATFFAWSPNGRRVAGQWYGGPPQFWLWDRVADQSIPTGQLPGQHQYFESWSPDGESILFTSWEEGWPYQGGNATLYRLDLRDGRLEVVAEDAALPTWSGAYLAYVILKPELTLVVKEASSGRELWRESLGPRDEVEPGDWDRLRPVLAGSCISYRKVDESVWVSPAARRDPRWLHSGADSLLIWSPDARHLAIASGGSPLRVVRNPHVD